MEHLVGSTITVPSGKLPLVVVHREIDNQRSRARHWSLVVILPGDDCEVHELVGNHDSFGYICRFRRDISRSRMYRGGVLIGYIDPTQVSPQRFRNSGDDLVDSELIRWLRTVEIIRGTPAFNCQVWIVRALVVLREKGVILPGVNELRIRNELDVEEERDDHGLDLITERITFL